MPKSPVTKKPRKPARRRRKDARPGELIAAALALFIERGYAATRLDDVAQRAGVAKGTVYLYFKDKRALFDGVMRDAILPELHRTELHAEQHSGATEDVLRDILDAWLTLLDDPRFSRLPKLMITDADRFPELSIAFHDIVISRARRLLERILWRGVERREFNIEDVEATVEVLLSTLWMPALAKHSAGFQVGGEPSLRAYADALIALVLGGIGPRRVEPGRRRTGR